MSEIQRPYERLFGAVFYGFLYRRECKQEYLGRVEAFKTKYEHAGVDGAYGAGLEFGKLTMAGLGLIAGAAGVGKLGVRLTNDSIKAAEKVALKGPLSYADEPFFNPYVTVFELMLVLS